MAVKAVDFTEGLASSMGLSRRAAVPKMRRSARWHFLVQKLQPSEDVHGHESAALGLIFQSFGSRQFNLDPMCLRLLTALVATSLSSSWASFQLGTEGRVMWQTNCDYFGRDLASMTGIPQVCGTFCVNDPQCTHWSWSYFNGGTCWLKNGATDALFTHHGRECGYVRARVSSSSTTDHAHKKWAKQKAKQDTKAAHKVAQKHKAKKHKAKKHKAKKYKNGLTRTETAEMLARINAYRAGNGLTAVTIDTRLMAASLVHSKDQATHCRMIHEGTDGLSPVARIEDQGYDWSVTTENVAAGQKSVSEVMESWWQSPHHRANILKDDVKNVGFAVAYNKDCSEYTSFWTQDFAA